LRKIAMDFGKNREAKMLKNIILSICLDLYRLATFYSAKYT
jgi:hypothetical protein